MILAFQAGLLDVGGLLACQSFVSHVTGYAPHFAIEMHLGRWAHALALLFIPLTFLGGAMVSGVLVDLRLKQKMDPRYWVVFGVLFLLMLIVVILGFNNQFGEFGKPISDIHGYLLAFFLCLICGIQNGTITLVSSSVIRTTHLTGVTTDLGIGLVRVLNSRRLSGKIPDEGKANIMRAGIISFFVFGALIGVSLFREWQFRGFLFPCLISGVLFAMTLYFQVLRRAKRARFMGLRSIIVTSLILSSIFLPKQIWAANSYSVAAGGSVEITEFAVCKGVDNGLSKAIFVPTKTDPEWTAFYTNPPPGIAISECANDWYNSNWGYRVRITIDPTKVDATLTNFPVLITEANMPASFFTNVKSDGSDIVVTQADGVTKLDRELERISVGSSLMELWVRIPSLDDITPTVIFLYYGYASAAETNATTTWSAYRNVYHMAATTPPDATGTTGTGGSSGATLTSSGKIGQGLDFSSSGKIDLSSSISGANFKTLSVWYYPRTKGGGNYGSIFGSNSYNDGVRHLNTNETNLRRSGSAVVSSSASFSTWKHLVFAYDSGTGQITLYENGSPGTATTLTGGWYNLYHLVGINGVTNRAPDAIIDEMRITNTTLTSTWISTEFNNQNSPSTFYDVGPEVAKP